MEPPEKDLKAVINAIGEENIKVEVPIS